MVGITERVIWHPLSNLCLFDAVHWLRSPFCVQRSLAFFLYKGGEQFGKALGNTVGTAFGFSICFIFIPPFFDTLDISCRQSWLVWEPQAHECSLWPLHLALVLSICLVHCLLNLWSVGNWMKSLHPYENCLSIYHTTLYHVQTHGSFPLVRHAIDTPLNSSKLKYMYGRCSYTSCIFKSIFFTQTSFFNFYKKIFTNLKCIRLQIHNKNVEKFFTKVTL